MSCTRLYTLGTNYIEEFSFFLEQFEDVERPEHSRCISIMDCKTIHELGQDVLNEMNNILYKRSVSLGGASIGIGYLSQTSLLPIM